MEYRRLQGSDENLEDTVRLLRAPLVSGQPSNRGAQWDKEEQEDVTERDQAGRNILPVSESDDITRTSTECEEELLDADIHIVTPGNETTHHHVPTKTTFYVLFAALMAALGGVLFGYDIGIISGALLQLKDDFSLSCFQQEMIVSSMLIGATVGSLLGGFIIDSIGRRKAIIINSSLFIVGAVILSSASSYAILVIGRLIIGFAVSLSVTAECIYISEIAPKERRGQLVSINEIGISLGLLLSYLINFCFIKVPSGWRYMFGLSALPALCQCLGMLVLPASPRFLVRQKRHACAADVLRRLRGTSEVSEELLAIQSSVTMEKSYSVLDLFRSRENMRWRMGIGACLVFLQQITGQTNIVYYAPTVLEYLGFEDNVSAILASVGLGVAKVIGTSTCLLLVDRCGRRIFLLLGSGFMAVFIITLGIQTQAFPASLITDPCHSAFLPASDSNISTTERMYMKLERRSQHLSGDEVDDQFIPLDLKQLKPPRDAPLDKGAETRYQAGGGVASQHVPGDEVDDQFIPLDLMQLKPSRDAPLDKRKAVHQHQGEGEIANQLNQDSTSSQRYTEDDDVGLSYHIIKNFAHADRKNAGHSLHIHQVAKGIEIKSSTPGPKIRTSRPFSGMGNAQAMSRITNHHGNLINKNTRDYFGTAQSIIHAPYDDLRRKQLVMWNRIKRGEDAESTTSNQESLFDITTTTSQKSSLVSVLQTIGGKPIADSTITYSSQIVTMESQKDGSDSGGRTSMESQQRSQTQQTTVTMERQTELRNEQGKVIIESQEGRNKSQGTVTAESKKGTNDERDDVHVSAATKWTALMSVILYVGAYSFGFGPISWLVISEIFPAGIRGRASSLTSVFNWGSNVIISLTFLDVLKKFGISWTLLTYGFVCCASFVFILVAIPETKNQTLEQISEQLSKRSPVGHLCSSPSCLKCCRPSDCCYGSPSSSSSYSPAPMVNDDSTV